MAYSEYIAESANILGLLKKHYSDIIAKTTPDKCALWDMFEEEVKEVPGGGESWTENIEGPIGGGVAEHDDTGAMPLAKYNPTQQVTVTPKLMSATFSLSLFAMERSKGSSSSYAKLVQREIDNIRKKLRRFCWVGLWQDATGCVGKIASVAGDHVTITLDTIATDAPTNALWINPGDLLNCWDAKVAGTQQVGAGAATNVEVSTGGPNESLDVIVMAEAVDGAGTPWGAGDYLFRYGSKKAASTFRSPNGLQNLVDDTSTHLLAPGTNPFWKSKLIDVAGPLDRRHIHREINSIKRFNDGVANVKMVCALDHQDDIAELIYPIWHEPRGSRTVGGYAGGKGRDGTGGTIAWQWPGSEPVDILFDDMCLPGSMWFIDTDHIKRNVLFKPRFVDEGQGVLPAMRRPSYQLWDGHVTTSYNIFTDGRKYHGKLYGITGYVPLT